MELEQPIITKIDDTYSKEQFDCDLEMLKYFQSEFSNRLNRFWDIANKIFTLVVIICLLPFVSEIAGIKLTETARLYSLCFPVIAFLVAFVGKILLDDESRNIRAVNTAKYRLNRLFMIERYHYDYYNDDVGKKQSHDTIDPNVLRKQEKRWSSTTLPSKIFAVELFIIATSAVVTIINWF